MKRRSVLFLMLTAGLLCMLMAGCGGEEKSLIADAEVVMDRVIDLADPNPPGEDEPSPSPEPSPSQTPAAEETTPASGEPSGASADAGALRPGTYEAGDGSVLEVAEDGTCTYETVISGTVNGEPMSGAVTFHGSVENGDIVFTKITYFGLDITALAAAAGYDDPSYWEAAAQSLYNG